MRTFFLLLALLSLNDIHSHAAHNKAGFSLPDSLQEFTLRYHSIDNLIILPVKINGTTEVNLILDTGCRNVVLFGKKFQRQFTMVPNKVIEFSGMGTGEGVKGSLSLNNTVTIDAIAGNSMPIIIVPSDKIFRHYENIDGLIGYDIFTRFEVEINPRKQLITFRPCTNSYIPSGYSKINFNVSDSKPVINSSILLNNNLIPSQLIIDTGSTLGLLIKSTDKEKFNLNKATHTLGLGVNGLLKGIQTRSQQLHLNTFSLNNIPTGIIFSPWHDYASLGMDVLKDYSIILNYAQSYLCLKKLS